MDQLIVAHPGLVWLEFLGEELVGISGAVVHDRYDPGKSDRIIRDYNARRAERKTEETSHG